MKKDTLLSLGLDLGGHCAKAVLLKLSGKEPLLKGVKKFSVSIEGKTLPPEALIEQIKLNLKDWCEVAGKINVQVSGKDVIVRYLEMPKMTSTELKSSLKYEAIRYLPFKLSDASFYTQILLDSLPNDPRKMWVILVAVKNNVLEKQLNLLKQAGISPTGVQVIPTSLFNAFESFAPPEDLEKVVLLAEVGAKMTTINIMRHGVPYLSREVDFGGEMLTQLLVREKGISYENAEKEKAQNAFDWEIDLQRLVQPFVKAIKTSFLYFEGKSEKNVAKVVLSGGSASLKNFDEFLSKQLNISVSIFSPTSNLKKEMSPEEEKLFEAQHSLFTGALGLAAQGKGT